MCKNFFETYKMETDNDLHVCKSNQMTLFNVIKVFIFFKGKKKESGYLSVFVKKKLGISDCELFFNQEIVAYKWIYFK